MKNKSVSLLLAAVLVSVLILAACGGAQQAQPPTQAPSGPAGIPALERPSPPEEYAGKTNPLAGDKAAAEAGKALFGKNCVSCHGETGRGDGSASSSLDPRPGNLAENQKSLDDDYLFWRISDGGLMEPFPSAMPAWKTVLDDEQIWQLVTHLRSLGN